MVQGIYNNHLINIQTGRAISANAGDYFTYPDNYVFQGYQLVISERDANGKEDIIRRLDNPKKSDLINAIGKKSEFQPKNEVIVLSPADTPILK